MNVSIGSWHGRVYAFWYRMKYGYKLPMEEGVGAATVNLCYYVRVVLFWSWLRWFFLSGKAGRVPVAFLSWTAILAALVLGTYLIWGWPAIVTWLQILLALGSLAAVIGIICLFVWFKDDSGVPERMGEAWHSSSFRQILAARLHGIHQKICPLIVIVPKGLDEGRNLEKEPIGKFQ